MTTYKIHKISFGRDDHLSKIAELENLLNTGWIIERCDTAHVSTGNSISYGPMLYVLSKTTL